MNRIVHLCTRADWNAALVKETYRTGSLAGEGFIHCSRPEQILGVANRFYAGQTGLLLLWIDPDRLQSELRWESSDGDTFPHLYGPINLDAVTAVTVFDADADGVFRRLSPPEK
jgi:uncharacterized protein (DUF952 family)